MTISPLSGRIYHAISLIIVDFPPHETHTSAVFLPHCISKENFSNTLLSSYAKEIFSNEILPSLNINFFHFSYCSSEGALSIKFRSLSTWVKYPVSSLKLPVDASTEEFRNHASEIRAANKPNENDQLVRLK